MTGADILIQRSATAAISYLANYSSVFILAFLLSDAICGKLECLIVTFIATVYDKVILWFT